MVVSTSKDRERDLRWSFGSGRQEEPPIYLVSDGIIIGLVDGEIIFEA